MAKAFQGKQTRAEEMAEAKAVRSGRVSPAQYARGEKSEGDKASTATLKARGQALASGRMSPAEYAGKASGVPKKMADGGLVHSGFSAPNTPTGACGPGVRSHQDYKK